MQAMLNTVAEEAIQRNANVSKLVNTARNQKLFIKNGFWFASPGYIYTHLLHQSKVGWYNLTTNMFQTRAPDNVEEIDTLTGIAGPDACLSAKHERSESPTPEQNKKSKLEAQGSAVKEPVAKGEDTDIDEPVAAKVPVAADEPVAAKVEPTNESEDADNEESDDEHEDMMAALRAKNSKKPHMVDFQEYDDDNLSAQRCWDPHVREGYVSVASYSAIHEYQRPCVICKKGCDPLFITSETLRQRDRTYSFLPSKMKTMLPTFQRYIKGRIDTDDLDPDDSDYEETIADAEKEAEKFTKKVKARAKAILKMKPFKYELETLKLEAEFMVQHWPDDTTGLMENLKELATKKVKVQAACLTCFAHVWGREWLYLLTDGIHRTATIKDSKNEDITDWFTQWLPDEFADDGVMFKEHMHIIDEPEGDDEWQGEIEEPPSAVEGEDAAEPSADEGEDAAEPSADEGEDAAEPLSADEDEDAHSDGEDSYYSDAYECNENVSLSDLQGLKPDMARVLELIDTGEYMDAVTLAEDCLIDADSFHSPNEEDDELELKDLLKDAASFMGEPGNDHAEETESAPLRDDRPNIDGDVTREVVAHLCRYARKWHEVRLAVDDYKKVVKKHYGKLIDSAALYDHRDVDDMIKDIQAHLTWLGGTDCTIKSALQERLGELLNIVYVEDSADDEREEEDDVREKQKESAHALLHKASKEQLLALRQGLDWCIKKQCPPYADYQERKKAAKPLFRVCKIWYPELDEGLKPGATEPSDDDTDDDEDMEGSDADDEDMQGSDADDEDMQGSDAEETEAEDTKEKTRQMEYGGYKDFTAQNLRKMVALEIRKK